MSIEIFEDIPGGNPQSRRPAWAAERGGPIDAPDDIQNRRQNPYYLVSQNTPGYGNRYDLSDDLVPQVPDEIQSKRSRGFLVTTQSGDQIELARHDFSDRQRAYVPLQGLMGLGEDVALLEALGENQSMQVDDFSSRKDKLRDLADKRRQAICKAGVERDKALDRVFRYDRTINVLAAQLKAATDPAVIADLTARIKKLDALRAIAGGNAVRFAKVQALGQAMLKSAQTETNFLTLSEIASKKGYANEASIFKQAADKAASNDQHYGDLRKKQVANWTVATADAKLRALNALAVQVATDIANLTNTPVNAAQEAEKQRQLASLKVKQERIAAKLAETKSQIVQAGITADQAAVADATPAVEKKAELSKAFLGLEADLGFSIGGALSSIGNAVKSAAGAVKDGVKAAANAGIDLAKKGACALAHNPKVLGAIATTAASAAGGPAAGAGAAAATPAAAALLSGACPSTPTPAASPLAPLATMTAAVSFQSAARGSAVNAAARANAAAGVQPTSSKVVPIAVGVGAAGIIAALIALA